MWRARDHARYTSSRPSFSTYCFLSSIFIVIFMFGSVHVSAGNKYGEPVVSGFTRSFGAHLPNGERVEWIKPVMFTAGIGMLDAKHAAKGQPEKEMLVCKIGGPAYRIGMGGGAASSRVQSEDDSTTTDEELAALDFDAVQRGDAEMGNRLNRFVRACVELVERNPIVSIHDQGAGGNGNVLKEIVEPLVRAPRDTAYALLFEIESISVQM